MVCRENLALIAMLASIAGIALLLLLGQSAGARQARVSEISEEMVGLLVRVNARIEKLSMRDGIAFMELYDGTGKINAVLFNAGNAELPGKGGFASVEGKVQEYGGKLEIVAEKVEEWH